MKRGIWGLGWWALLGGVSACGGQAVAITDSGGSAGTAPGAGGATARGGASSYPGNGGSTSSNPGSGGTVQAGSVFIMPDPGSASCTDFKPCGGDLVGEWRFDDVCATPALPTDNPYCATDSVTSRIGGSLIFEGNGQVDPITVLTNHHVVPPNCIADLGGCGSGVGVLAGCQLDASGSCVCDVTEQSTEPAETFVAASNFFLLFESTTPQPIAIYYCRQGENLIMRGYDAGRVFVYQLTKESTLPPK